MDSSVSSSEVLEEKFKQVIIQTLFIFISLIVLVFSASNVTVRVPSVHAHQRCLQGWSSQQVLDKVSDNMWPFGPFF